MRTRGKENTNDTNTANGTNKSI